MQEFGSLKALMGAMRVARSNVHRIKIVPRAKANATPAKPGRYCAALVRVKPLKYRPTR